MNAFADGSDKIFKVLALFLPQYKLKRFSET